MSRRTTQRPSLDLSSDKGLISDPATDDIESVFDDNPGQESRPLLKKCLKDVFVDVDENDLRWRRCPQAAILSRLPSHRALSSDQGYTLSRTLEKARRRRRSTRAQSDGGRPSVMDIESHPDVISERTLTKRKSRRKSSKGYEVPVLDEVDGDSEFLRKESVRSMTASLAVKRKYRLSREVVYWPWRFVDSVNGLSLYSIGSGEFS